MREWLQREGQEGFERQLSLGSLNGYRRKLLFQELPKLFPKLVLESTGTHQYYKTLLAHCLDDAAREAKREQMRVEEKLKLTTQIGFRLVFEALMRSRKPLVGHNLTTDLMHLWHRLHSPLPPSYALWKRDLNRCFPVIVDTKHIIGLLVSLDASIPRLPNTSLGILFDAVLAPPFSQTPTIQQCHSPDAQQLHDAAYDAYITGVVAIRLLTPLLAILRSPPPVPDLVEQIETLPSSSSSSASSPSSFSSSSLQVDDGEDLGESLDLPSSTFTAHHSSANPSEISVGSSSDPDLLLNHPLLLQHFNRLHQTSSCDWQLDGPEIMGSREGVYCLRAAPGTRLLDSQQLLLSLGLPQQGLESSVSNSGDLAYLTLKPRSPEPLQDFHE
ncbi:MAG: CAF1 family ribonuclease, partial [archaeon]|nr:CAF1 family ribonuclease [archaeon]